MPTPAADLLETLVREAAGRHASDLAFEPEDDGSLVAMARIDGVRTVLGRIPATLAGATLARAKALAALPAYVTDTPQDGRWDGRPFGIPGDVRVAVLPTVRGQRLALRLPAIGALPAPGDLGLPRTVIRGLSEAVARPQGLVILTGPTGSGKTTTLHSLLAAEAAARPDRHVLTIEDPVERRLPGMTQVEARHDLGFAAALSAALRHDPDVLVVGEVRDPATATACVRAALTGHLVLTTVHAGRAHEVVPRLVDMGVDPDLLLPSLVAVVAQRLVRLVHETCGGRGCSACSGGFLGRRPLADFLVVDEAARAVLRQGGRPTLLADLDHQAAALVAEGATTSAEIRRLTGARA